MKIETVRDITQGQLYNHAIDGTFELTLDGDAAKNQPIEMVRCDGYGKPEKWKFMGKKVVGTNTRQFKLVSIGFCHNLNEVRQKLADARREIPEGQWREAFKDVFHTSDGNGPIGIADPSWMFPDGLVGFPCVSTDGDSEFVWTGYVCGGIWRWLVYVGN